MQDEPTRESSSTRTEQTSASPVLPSVTTERAAERPGTSGGDTAGPDTNSAASPAPREQDTAGWPQKASRRTLRRAMPVPLRGSLESLERQNARLDADGLERIEDEADLADRIEHGLLVPIPASDALAVNPELPAMHRYCRPWTADFLADLALAHSVEFHRPIEVSSAVRTIEYQKRLMRTNGNAAPAEGDIASPHLTGATVDIAKAGMSRAEIAWMRQRLLRLEVDGKIDVEEEFHQSCFHIAVYKSYAAEPAAAPEGQTRSGSATRTKKATYSSTATVSKGM
jgi:hypothetical protein